jgi:hypothetical protein
MRVEPNRAGGLIAGRKSIFFDIPGNKGTRRITQTILIAMKESLPIGETFVMGRWSFCCPTNGG